jgi:DNA-binding winged helix-turn-helix (wHTH) protein
MSASGLTTVSGHSPQLHPETAAQHQSGPGSVWTRAGQSQNTGKLYLVGGTERSHAAPSELAFDAFRVIPAQFLMLENDKPVTIGSRALEILTVLLERPGELVTRQELMARVWPNVIVEPANLTVHISALRRTLRDGEDGNRFIVNIPGRGYSFVATVVAHKASDRADE